MRIRVVRNASMTRGNKENVSSGVRSVLARESETSEDSTYKNSRSRFGSVALNNYRDNQ